MIKGILTLCTLLGLAMSPQSHAFWVEKDFLNEGDGLLTLDTRTGLEWLDVSLFDGLSLSEVMALERERPEFAGFRVASRDQWSFYFNGFDLVYREDIGFNMWEAEALFELSRSLGMEPPDAGFLSWTLVYGDGVGPDEWPEGLMYSWADIQYPYAEFDWSWPVCNMIDHDWCPDFRGTWLMVRQSPMAAVPEPAGLGLLLLGLALAVRRTLGAPALNRPASWIWR